MKKCPSCGKEIKDEAVTCGHCGMVFDEKANGAAGAGIDEKAKGSELPRGYSPDPEPYEEGNPSE